MNKKFKKLNSDEDSDNNKENRKIKYRQERHKTKQLIKKILAGHFELEDIDDIIENK